MSNNVGTLSTPNLQDGSAVVEVHDNGIIGLNGNIWDIKFPRGYIYSQTSDKQGLEQLVVSSHILNYEDYRSGSRLALHHGSDNIESGSFELVSGTNSDGSDSSILKGNPNRSITWCGYLLSQLSMPSNKYIDLTLGASGFNYYSSHNGYICLQGTTNAAGGWLSIITTTNDIENFGISTLSDSTIGAGLALTIPISTNTKAHITYNKVDITRFRFIYSVLDSIITE